MRTEIFSVIYHSVAEPSVSTDDVAAIVRVAQARNESINVTGILAFYNRQFMQLLEGNMPDVTNVLQSIKRDPRHHSLRILSTQVYEKRQCEGWGLVSLPITEITQDTMAAAEFGEARRFSVRFPVELSIENKSFFSAFLAEEKEPIVVERPLKPKSNKPDPKI